MEEEIEEEEEEIEEEGGYVAEKAEEYNGAGKENEMATLMVRLKKREQKEKAADLISKLRGKKKVNKKIMPYEIYATSGQ